MFQPRIHFVYFVCFVAISSCIVMYRINDSFYCHWSSMKTQPAIAPYDQAVSPLLRKALSMAPSDQRFAQ